ncbi:MAG TPA: histidine phosphatase family protein [Chloroflexota bacterium]
MYVVRHAEVHNPNDILYGRLPRFRLSARGREQAALLGRFLTGRPITAIYTSPLLRARETAATISRELGNIPVRRSNLLVEVRTGYQGSPNSIVKPGFTFYDPKHHPADESMEDVYARFERFLRLAVRRHPGQAIAAVSHADPIAIMRLGLTGQPFTASSLHSTVYPARASINLVALEPHADPLLTYFNVAGAQA